MNEAVKRLRRIFGRSEATQTMVAIVGSATVNGNEMRALLDVADAAAAVDAAKYGTAQHAQLLIRMRVALSHLESLP